MSRRRRRRRRGGRVRSAEWGPWSERQSRGGGRILVAGLATAGAAEAAVKCAPPGSGPWREAAPAAAGMDGKRLKRAIAYGMDNGAAAIRVYRNGYRVGVDVQ